MDLRYDLRNYGGLKMGYVKINVLVNKIKELETLKVAKKGLYSEIEILEGKIEVLNWVLDNG